MSKSIIFCFRYTFPADVEFTKSSAADMTTLQWTGLMLLNTKHHHHHDLEGSQPEWEKKLFCPGASSPESFTTSSETKRLSTILDSRRER